MKTIIETSDWNWYQFEKNELDDMKPLLKNDESFHEWLKLIEKGTSNSLRIDLYEKNEEIIKGSLIYMQNFEDENSFEIFHFHITHNLLVTVDLNFSLLKKTKIDLMLKQIEQVDNAIDGFIIILGKLLNEYLDGIDHFEDELKKLIWNVHNRNETRTLDKIFKRRHELLVWKNLLIPFQELMMGIEEVYLEDVIGETYFTRTNKRLERAMTLIDEYGVEIDSIIHLEEVISSHRGNEIMKTLTVITTIFTPLMAYGALWGMNFTNMPELKWKYGYVFSLFLIVLSTLGLYGFLKMKGWTGDLLKSRKKGSFFK